MAFPGIPMDFQSKKWVCLQISHLKPSQTYCLIIIFPISSHKMTMNMAIFSITTTIYTAICVQLVIGVPVVSISNDGMCPSYGNSPAGVPPWRAGTPQGIIQGFIHRSSPWSADPRKRVASWLNAAAAARPWWRPPAGAGAQGGVKPSEEVEDLEWKLAEKCGETMRNSIFVSVFFWISLWQKGEKEQIGISPGFRG